MDGDISNQVRRAESFVFSRIQILTKRNCSRFLELLPYQLRLMRHVLAVIAIGVHEQLGVGVDRDEGLEVAVVLDQVHHVLHLNLRVS